MRLEVIVNPAREHGRFHRRAPRLWQRFHPQVQVKTCGGERSFGENLATAVFHAIADLPLVNIQSDVIHRFHGGSLLGVSESASAEFSFCTPSAPPLTYTFKLIRSLAATGEVQMDSWTGYPSASRFRASASKMTCLHSSKNSAPKDL